MGSEALAITTVGDGALQSGAPKSPSGRVSRKESTIARRSVSDSEAFWVAAAATAYSLDVFTSDPNASTILAAPTKATAHVLARLQEVEAAAVEALQTKAVEGGDSAAVAEAEEKPQAESSDLSVAQNAETGVAQADGSDAVLAAAQAPAGSSAGRTPELNVEQESAPGDVYWRQTEALIAEGNAVEITGVEGDVVFEGVASLIGLGGAAVLIEAKGDVSVSAEAAFAGDEAAISATSSGEGDVAIDFSGAAAAGAADAALEASLSKLEAKLDAVEAVLDELEDEAAAAAELQPQEKPVAEDRAQEIEKEAAEAAAHSEALDLKADAIDESVEEVLQIAEAVEGEGLKVSANAEGATVELGDADLTPETAAEDAVEECSAGQSYLAEMSQAVDHAMGRVVDSFEFSPAFVDGALGQLANVSAVGLLANTQGGGVSVVADGVVLASGDAVSLSSEEGEVAATIDGVLVGGRAAFSAEGEEVTARLEGTAVGAETGIEIEARAKAEVELNGVVRSSEGAAVRVAASEGDVELKVDGEVLSAGGVGLEIEAAHDVEMRIDGVVQGGIALTGVVDGVLFHRGNEVDIDVRGQVVGGHVAGSGSAAAISVEESFGADVRLTVVGDAWVEAGFVGLERDKAIRLGAGRDQIEIEGRVIGDVDLGAGDDVLRLDKDGSIEGAINGGRGVDVFHAGDLADLFEMTFGSGSDVVHGFGFGDRFDFSALAEYNDDGAAAALELNFWDEGEDVATLSYFDGEADAELTLYGDDLDQINFDDVFVWV